MSSKGIQQLAADIARQKDKELQQEISERRHFESLGLDYAAVQRARAVSAAEAFAQAAEDRRIPYQLSLPGVNATLMSLRSREPIHPAEAAAAGVVGLVGWQRAPEPVGTQLEFEFSVPMNGIRRAVPLQGRTTAPIPAALDRMAGDRLMRILAVASMMGGAGAGAVAEAYDQDGSQF